MDAIYQTANGRTIVVKWRGEKTYSFVNREFSISVKKCRPLLIFAPVFPHDPFLRRMRCRACKESNTGNGPITIRTPYGLGVDEWADGLEKYAKAYQALDGADNYDIKKK